MLDELSQMVKMKFVFTLNKSFWHLYNLMFFEDKDMLTRYKHI
jgi:hypothetical protein